MGKKRGREADGKAPQAEDLTVDKMDEDDSSDDEASKAKRY
jgi:hypothetical protein